MGRQRRKRKLCAPQVNGGATIRLMAEAHFDLIDADRNPNGIKVIRLNGSGSDSEKSTVYYNNSASGPSLNSIVGDGADVSLDGADSTNGAMRFTDVNTSGYRPCRGDGDKSAIDVWTYGSCWQTTFAIHFKLADTSFLLPMFCGTTPAGRWQRAIRQRHAYA